MADGSHTFEVRATDSLSNTDDTPAVYTWTIDATAPDTIITAGPPNPSNDATPSFEFASTEPDSTFECRLDSPTFTACDTPLIDAGPVADGIRTFEVRATDSRGNTDATPATYTWRIDTTAPITAEPSSTTGVGGGGSAEEGDSRSTFGIISGIALAALALLALLMLLAKRRRRQEEA